MNNLCKNISNATLIAVFIFGTLFLAGCGDNELAKGMTDIMKKTVEGEVTKKIGEVKKQFDQVLNMGTGKKQKEDGEGDAKVGKEKSAKDSGKEREDEKD
jgi:hypothetical protein